MALLMDALYENLQEDLSDYGIRTAEIAPEDSGWTVACKTLLSTFRKKYVDDVKPDADLKALAKFADANERCASWSLPELSELDYVLLSTFREEFLKVAERIDLSSARIYDSGRNGPGSALGAVGTDSYTKQYASPGAATSRALIRNFRYNTTVDPRAFAAEQFRLEHCGSPEVVRGSKLIFVPKSDEISRVICVEPSLNMYYQLGLGRLIEDELFRSYSISLSKQPDYNRELAYRGSAHGHLATIDLASASDSISLRMLETLVPCSLIAWCKSLRSSETQLPDGSWLELSMISSMGNGTTFPLETLIFAASVAAVYSLDGIRRENGPDGNFGVFGDDIICLARCARKVIRLLELLGFQTNSDKTFFEGPFRESCGADFHGGYPVRGVYLKSLATPQDRFVAINRLMLWCATHGVVLKRVIHALLDTVPRNYVPLYENDDAGIKVPLWKARPKRHEGTQGFLYKRYSAKPVYLRFEDDMLIVPRKERRRVLNPHGAFLAFLSGHIRNGRLGIRTPRVYYGLRRTVTSSWDQPSRDVESVGLAAYHDMVSNTF